MLNTSLLFLALAVAAAAGGDLEITTLAPWPELLRMIQGALTPDFRSLFTIFGALLNTVIFALCGIVLGVAAGGMLALFFDRAGVRLFCAFIRAIHELFWAFLFMPLVGLYPICGILAIAVPYAGTFGKVYAEIREESDQRPETVLPEDSGRISRFLYGVLPGIYEDLKSYTGYRFECALRSSAILGFIGLPTLGYHLETAFREGLYSEAAALLYFFYLLIASLRLWARPRFIWLPILLAFILVSKETNLSVDNISRFLAWEIIPWPMRQAGVADGTMTLALPLHNTWLWLQDILHSEIIPGLFNTVILTQIALGASAIFALVSFPPATIHFGNRATRWLTHAVLIVLRTTPEYILAYIFLQLWGPSMLPAAMALVLHNGAILGFLNSSHANHLVTRIDAPRRKADRYFFEIVPRIYGQFLAFLFYRWEIIMRESAILGILGVATLGFYVDSAIADDHLDKALLLIMVTALLNITIDTFSQYWRKKLHRKRLKAPKNGCVAYNS